MATITIRNLDIGRKAALRVQAARHGRSMEEEVRQKLQANVGPAAAAGKIPTGAHIADAIVALFAPLAPFELEIPPRIAGREPPDFSGPDHN